MAVILHHEYNIFDDTVVIVSMISLVIYLIMNSSREKLKNLPNRTLYSYCVTLLLLYVNHILCRLPRYDFLEPNATKFFSYFANEAIYFWTFIVSYEYWRVTYSSIKKRKIVVEGQTKRYLMYCFFGWILPAIFVAILLILDEITLRKCLATRSRLSNHQTRAAAVYSCNSVVSIPFMLTVAQILTVFSCVLFVTVGVVLVFYIVLSDHIESNVKRNTILVFTKIAYMSNGFWLFLFCIMIGASGSSVEMAETVWVVLFSFQGTFVFFAFGSGKSVLAGVWAKCKSTVASLCDCSGCIVDKASFQLDGERITQIDTISKIVVME